MVPISILWMDVIFFIGLTDVNLLPILRRIPGAPRFPHRPEAPPMFPRTPGTSPALPTRSTAKPLGRRICGEAIVFTARPEAVSRRWRTSARIAAPLSWVA